MSLVPRRLFGRAAGLLAGAALAAGSLVHVAPTASAAYDENRGPNTSDRVVLSFDDCPKSLSQFRQTVLDAEALDIGLVLFPTGDCVSGGQFDAAFARAHGHYVFNHSVSHPDLRTLSQAGVERQLGAPGIVTSYGRPPYGALNATARAGYAAVGMKPWLWTVDTNDWRGKSTSELVSYVTSTAVKGDTVLMHMQWNAFNKGALSAMKSGLARRGIGVCRNYPGTTPVRPSGVNCEGGSTPAPAPKPVLGDENGDGRSDVLGVDTRGRLSLYTTSASMALSNAGQVGAGWTNTTWASRVPDVTGDGRSDLLGRRTDGTLWLYPGKGNGRFGAATRVGTGWNTMDKLVVLPDVNGDRSPELLAVSAKGYLESYRITARGLSHQLRVGHGWGSGISYLTTVGSSSGDANPDLLAVKTDGTLVSYTMNAAGRVTGTRQVGHGWKGFTVVYSPGDLSKDGRRDLVARRSDGTLSVYRHTGGGTFAGPTQIGKGWNSIRLFL